LPGFKLSGRYRRKAGERERTSSSVAKSKSRNSASRNKSGKAGAVKTRKPAIAAKRAERREPAKVGSTGNKIEAPIRREEAEIMQTAVTSGAKPKKNQAGISPKELEHFRDLLLAKRRELVGDMSSMEREALRSTTGSNLSNLPIHMADMGTDNYEQEFTLGLVEKDRVLLREINVALAKIQDGSYGICEGTGKPIGKARLEAKPWARFSIEYTRKMENGMVR
jgi:DnaK suppressor protein